jgi:5,10-methylenetetrahydromethanopterin reductase
MADVDAGSKRLTGVGVVLRDPLPWSDERQLAETAEGMGYRALFVPEIAGREAFSILTGFADATVTTLLGTGVVTMWSRSPTITAMAAATVQDMSEGRLILGLGAGSMPPTAETAVRPLDRLRRYVRSVRTALSGRPVPPDDPFGGSGFVLAPELTKEPPPIWLAALGDRSLGLAGQVADGVVMNWCTPERVRAARGILDQAARDAGRDPAQITVSVYVRACLGMSDDAALTALREPAGLYASIPHYLRQFELMSLGPEARAAAEAFHAGRPDDVPEGFVRALTVMGGRREAMERGRAYRDAGTDLVLWYPVPALDPMSSIMGTIMAAAPDPSIDG